MKIQLSEHFTYRKLLRFTLPSIVMLVFSSIYGVVDGFFVSNFVGKTAFTAVNFIIPFLMILGAVGFMFGTGGGALIRFLTGEELPPLTIHEKMSALRRQMLESVARLDEHRGILHIRRHLAATPLFKGIPNFRETRIAMLQADTVEALTAILDKIEYEILPNQVINEK